MKQKEWFEIMYDKKMEHGMAVTPTNVNISRQPIGFFDYGGEALYYPPKLNTTKDYTREYTWKFSQYGSKYDILNDDKNFQKLSEKKYKYEDRSKMFQIDISKGAWRMGLKASEEFEKPRTNSNDSWIGLLLQHNPVEKVMLKDMSNLKIRMRYTIDKVEMKMNEEEYDPNLHTAHIVFFFFIMNYENSDFYFAGLPLYDYRYVYSDEYMAQDNPEVKETTGKFTYCAGQKEFLKNPVKIGEEVIIEFDFLPNILRAFNSAQDRNFMKGAKFENLGIDGLNIGWELPGVFDIESSMNEFELLYQKK